MKSSGKRILANQLIEKARTGNVAIEWDHVLDEVLGDDAGVTGIRRGPPGHGGGLR